MSEESVAFQLGAIQNGLETITRTLSENRLADAQYRTGVRAEMTAQRDAINSVHTDLAIAKEDVAEMKPKVATLEERMHMSKGAANLAVILSRGVQLLIGAIGGLAAYFLSGWIHPK